MIGVLANIVIYGIIVRVIECNKACKICEYLDAKNSSFKKVDLVN